MRILVLGANGMIGAINQFLLASDTYLPGPIAGKFFFLYFVLDVYSRKIVAHEVHDAESAEHAAALIEQAPRRERIEGKTLIVHQDNRSPTKGSTYLAKLGIRSPSRVGTTTATSTATCSS